jgi:predicted ribosome quality control (RQC) complex YloA/Tae2 family protein
MDRKTEISSLDLRFLIKELKGKLAGGIFRKIYQYRTFEKTHQFLFEIFVPNKGEYWLYIDKNKIFLTTYKKPSPVQPPNFCLFLRKHLNNKRILDIKQHDFDRVVEIRTDENILIIELFSDGNLILCDRDYNIIMPLYIQKWKDRDLKPKIRYSYPPARVDPFSANFDYFVNFLKKYESKVIAVLATGFGFGATYAKEICLRAEVDDQKPSNELSLEELSNLHNTIVSIDKMKPSPVVYEDFVSPFLLEVMKSSTTKGKPESLSKAFDEFFSEQKIEEIEMKEEEIKEGEKAKVERILEKQEQAMEKWTDVRDESREIADTIYKFYGTIEGVLEGIRKARNSGLSWEEIKERIRSESTSEAEAIKEIREDEGIVVVEVGGKEIELDFRKSVEENAEDYYEGSKHAKKKIVGVTKALGETKERLESEIEMKPLEEEKPVKVVKKRKKWFEKFRWFRSSDGFLIVCGKDATSNEVLIKKHTDPNDLVFHSDIHGAPFVVIKSEGREISEDSKKEAAEFAAAYSKAWQMGLANVDVYCVRPDQVSKQPPSGEYLPKGSFMIYGQREWFREVELKLSIGVRIDRENEEVRVLSGPVMSIRKETDYFVTIKPGNQQAYDLAKTIKNKILIKSTPEDKVWIEKIPLEDFQKHIPSGIGEVIEYGV